MRKANISAAATAHQIPSRPEISGRAITQELWKTRVLRKETAAETAPLLSAVKNEDVNIFIPCKIKAKEKILKA